MICKKYSKGVQVQYIWKFRPKIFHLRMWWKFVDKFSRARRTRIWTQFYHNYNNKRNFTSDFIMEIIEKNKYLNLLKDAGLLWWKGIEMTLNTHIHTCTHTHTHTLTRAGHGRGGARSLVGCFLAAHAKVRSNRKIWNTCPRYTCTHSLRCHSTSSYSTNTWNTHKHKRYTPLYSTSNTLHQHLEYIIIHRLYSTKNT